LIDESQTTVLAELAAVVPVLAVVVHGAVVADWDNL